MPKYTDLAGAAGDTVLGAIETAQGTAITAVATAVSTVGNMLPAAPKTITLPDSVPTVSEIAETTFGLIERAVESQKKYALGLIGAFKPLTSKVIATNGSSK